MIPLCQINCAELPTRPEALMDVGFLTLFIAADRLPSVYTANGEGWLLRTYKAEQPLHLLQQPPSLEHSLKAFPIRWEFIEQDYPCWDDAVDLLGSKQHLLNVFEEYREQFPNHYCSKIGGWPSLIQHESFSNFVEKPTYLFQVDSEYKAHWAWGDNGIGHFAYFGNEGQYQWFLDWQQL